ncbi:MAG: cytochrome P450 [Bauldia sp.]|nr:cytochrome P450 [Bauldia sp.]
MTIVTLGEKDRAATGGCPVHAGADDRKAVPPAARAGDSRVVVDFAEARRVLRAGDETRQAGFGFELVDRFMPKANRPVLFEDGPAHQKQRSAIARFFAPKVVKTRYRDLMVSLTDELIEDFQRKGRAALDEISFELAVAVAAEIVGLTSSSRRGLARRLSRFLSIRLDRNAGWLPNLFSIARSQIYLVAFHFRDVRPAVRERRRVPREDVISHLLTQGYTPREIMMECVTYGAAGMATTREFIVMAAWHLVERPGLLARFLSTDEAGRMAILEEILRLEPVVGTIYRRTTAAFAGASPADASVPPGTLIAIDVRAANAGSAGACPHAIDPDRKPADERATGAVLSFGDGVHRCPGGSVALLESAIFLDSLLRVPGLRLSTPPRVTFNDLIASYELRRAIVECERV